MISSRADIKEWFYKDNEHREYGPFSAIEMKNLLSSGNIDKHTPVKSEEKKSYSSLQYRYIYAYLTDKASFDDYTFKYRSALPPKTTVELDGIPLDLYIVDEDVWLLTDVQVSKAYGVSNETIKSHLRRNKGKTLIEGVHWFMKHGKLPKGFPQLRLWTKDGLIKIGDYIKTPEAENLLTALGVKSRQRTRIESILVEIIKNTFESIFSIETQYPVKGFKVDVYIPELNLAIEIDEFQHRSYNLSFETTREQIIRETLNCELIRFNPNEPGNNEWKLINFILKHVKKIGLPFSVQSIS